MSKKEPLSHNVSHTQSQCDFHERNKVKHLVLDSAVVVLYENEMRLKVGVQATVTCLRKSSVLFTLSIVLMLCRVEKNINYIPFLHNLLVDVV